MTFQSYYQRYSLVLLFALAFLVWLFCFRTFIIQDSRFYSDAISYLDHTRFYLEQMQQGAFPMWNHVWYAGSPNDFFLLRIGVFNPFMFLAFILSSIGVDYTLAYIITLIIYFFIGTIGFYLLALRLTKDVPSSFVAFLLLLFSTLGTRMIDSYMLLIVVPLIWLFYFLILFLQHKSRLAFLGIVFSVLLLFTTYIPFFFVTIMLFFLVSFAIVYSSQVPHMIKAILEFFRRYWLTSILGIIVMILALMPGVFFFKDSKRTIVMPERNERVEDSSHVLSVSARKVAWSIPEDLLFSSYFIHDKRMKYASVYIPLFIFICIGLGIITSAHRRLLLYLVWGLSMLLLGSPYANDFYIWMREHVFYFKYFRNLHFYLWFLLIPLVILFAAEQFKAFLDIKAKTKKQHIWIMAWVTFVHVLALIFLLSHSGEMFTSFMVLLLSYVFFMNHIKQWVKLEPKALLGILLLINVVQPVEFYQHLFENAKHLPYGKYEIPDNSHQTFAFTRKAVARGDVDLKKEGELLYYASQRHNVLHASVGPDLLQYYTQHKFYWYDQWQIIDDKNINFDHIAHNIFHHNNIAYLAQEQGLNIPHPYQAQHSQSPQIITKAGEDFRVIDFSANHLTVQVNNPKQRLLTYTDNYHQYWNVYINTKEADLLRVNYAFKGVIVPQGEHQITFRYEPGMRLYIRILLLITSFVLLITLLFSRKDEFKQD